MVRKWNALMLNFLGLTGFMLLFSACSISSSLNGVSNSLSKIPVPPLFLSPSQNKTLMGGESLQFLASGGVEPYTFETSGSGQILSDGSYQAGFDYPNDEETITVTDSVGQTQSYTVPIRIFKTKESYNYTSGSVNTISNKIISASDGTLYVAGQSFSKWMILKSTDAGASWTALDSTQSSVLDSEAKGIAYHSTYGLYVIGFAKLPNNSHKSWIIRKSLDNGISWSTVYQYQMTSDADSLGTSIAISSNGNIFATGSVTGSDDVTRWNVIKSANSGQTWSIVDSILDSSTSDILVSNQNPNHIFVAGESNGYWTIKGSLDSGNTWQNLIYTDTVGTGRVFSLAMSSNGKLYAAGKIFYQTVTSPSGISGEHGVTMMSSNNGNTWSVSDYFYNSVRGVDFTSVTASSDPARPDDVYVTCNFQDDSPSWDFNYSIRKSTNAGTTWAQVDSYQIVNNISSYAISSTHSSDGHIYSVGHGALNALEASSQIFSMIVRKYNTVSLTNSNLSTYSQSYSRASSAQSITRTDLGVIYALGTGKSNNSRTDWIIRKSPDNGITWLPSDSRECGDYGCISKEIVSEPAGTRIYGIGTSQGNTTNDFFWMVRYSLDSGATWQHHTWQLAANRPAYGNSIKILSSGTILAAGAAFDASYQMKSIIRRSTNYGSTWTTIENSTSGATLKLYVDENDHVYSIGNRIVRKSTNQGTSWTTLHTAATDIFHDISVVGGNIYLLVRLNSTNYLQVRKSTDNGATWTVLDTYSEGSTTPESLLVTATGELLVTGSLKNANGVFSFIRRSVDSGVTWQTIEKRQYESQSNASIGKALFCESDKSKICYVGFGPDSNRVNQWLFKILDLTGL